MTIIARRVASTPTRSVAETWSKIVDLVAPDSSNPARTELEAASGVGCSSISSEAMKDAPVVLWQSGPRVRIYCLYDEDAITGDDVNEDPLAKSPTEGDWCMSIPCLPEDVEWSQQRLASISERITARSHDEDVTEDKTNAEMAAPLIDINLDEFLKS